MLLERIRVLRNESSSSSSSWSWIAPVFTSVATPSPSPPPPPQTTTTTTTTTAPPAPPIAAATIPPPPKTAAAPATSKKSGSAGVGGVDAKLQLAVLDYVVDAKTQSTRFADIVGADSAKQALMEAVVLPARRPDLFTGLRAPPKGILLFGPPGTGKTLLARATAAECGCIFFNISAASLTSKNYGDGEKLVRALFTVARHLQPAIIFVDEIDSLLTERGSANEHEASRRLKTEFLLQWDGIPAGAGADADRVIVIGATNRPQDLDDAVRRRLSYRIYVPLPERAARLQLLQHLLAKTAHTLTAADLSRLADMTEGFSGSDIANLARDASLAPIRALPASSLLASADVPVRPVAFDDFVAAARRVRPSVSADSLRPLLLFNSLYGSQQ